MGVGNYEATAGKFIEKQYIEHNNFKLVSGNMLFNMRLEKIWERNQD